MLCLRAPSCTLLAAASSSVDSAADCYANDDGSQCGPLEDGLKLLHFDTAGIGLPCDTEEGGSSNRDIGA